MWVSRIAGNNTGPREAPKVENEFGGLRPDFVT